MVITRTLYHQFRYPFTVIVLCKSECFDFKFTKILHDDTPSGITSSPFVHAFPSPPDGSIFNVPSPSIHVVSTAQAVFENIPNVNESPAATEY